MRFDRRNVGRHFILMLGWSFRIICIAFGLCRMGMSIFRDGGMRSKSIFLAKYRRGNIVRSAGALRRERGIWQRRFWEHTIRDERDYAAHVDYIHFNPVKHGLVECAADWPFSSFHRAVAKGLYPREWVFSGPGIGRCGRGLAIIAMEAAMGFTAFCPSYVLLPILRLAKACCSVAVEKIGVASRRVGTRGALASPPKFYLGTKVRDRRPAKL